MGGEVEVVANQETFGQASGSVRRPATTVSSEVVANQEAGHNGEFGSDQDITVLPSLIAPRSKREFTKTLRRDALCWSSRFKHPTTSFRAE